jgi:hypothetical protein
VSKPAVAVHASIGELKHLFADKQYAQAINQSSGSSRSTVEWVPDWTAVKWKDTDSVHSAYVPLLAQTTGATTTPVDILGVKNYLFIKGRAGAWSGKLLTYYRKAVKEDINQSALRTTNAFFTNYTGDLFIKDLNLNQTTHSAYINGVWQQPSLVQKVAKGTAMSNATATQECKAWYRCEWKLTCPAGYGDNSVQQYATSGPGCETPYYYTLGCGSYTQYQLLSEQFTHYVCEDKQPSDPPSPPPTYPEEPAPTPKPVPTTSDIIQNGPGNVGLAYVIRPSHNLSQILCLEYGYTGASVIQRTPTKTGTDQFWVLKPTGDGYYYVYSSDNTKYLNISGAHTYFGAKAVGWEFSSNYNAQWQFSLQPSGYYKITARHSGLALEIPGANTAEGVQADQWEYAGPNHQQWLVYEYSGF